MRPYITGITSLPVYSLLGREYNAGRMGLYYLIELGDLNNIGVLSRTGAMTSRVNKLQTCTRTRIYTVCYYALLVRVKFVF